MGFYDDHVEKEDGSEHATSSTKKKKKSGGKRGGGRSGGLNDDERPRKTVVRGGQVAVLNLRDDEGGTPLHLAAAAGNDRYVFLPTPSLASLQTVDTSNCVLCSCAICCCREVIALLKLGADAYAANVQGLTAFDVAAEGSYLDRVREKQDRDERDRRLFSRIFN